jgi:hypothetical protein
VCSIDVPKKFDGSGGGDRIIIVGSSTQYPGVGMEAPIPVSSMQFEPTKGILEIPGAPVNSFVFRSPVTSREVRVSVNRLGKSKVCSGSGQLLGGINPC